MKKNMMRSLFVAGMLSSCVFTSCEKYLDARPDKRLVVPTSVDDVQALLDHYPRMNSRDPGSGEISSDDYYLTDQSWARLSEEQRRMYTWEKDKLFPEDYNEWRDLYTTIYYANTALEALGKITPGTSDQMEWNSVRGQALFYRAKGFLQGILIWGKAYDDATASTDPGMPLRVNPDFTESVDRATVKETYEQIIRDLEHAIDLLPVTTAHPIRPSKAAANALLARVYLAMRKYDQAFLYADASLKIKTNLLDYNNFNGTASYPFAPHNMEVLHESMIPGPPPIYNTNARIIPDLIAAYDDNDLRKKLFFMKNADGSFSFKGSYEGNANLFSGITTAEVYLMRAECFARAGKTDDALKDLNMLLKNRWKTGTFISPDATNPDAVLQLVLHERRKELLMRGSRWMDLKRLNLEGAGIVLTRQLNGQVYTLPPGDNRYALPIPEDVISLTGMTQNSR